MIWSAEQAQALDDVGRWLRQSDKPFYYLAGFAGTGKTTLANHLAQGVKGQVFFAAFTGKAASVMRRKGCHSAQTLHSLLYVVQPKSRAHLEQMQALYDAKLEEHGVDYHASPAAVKLKAQIKEEAKRVGKPAFVLNPNSPLQDAALLVVDECSMVNEPMGEDVMSFGCPVLVLGDPAQLPPVYGAGYFTGGEPDFFLQEIQRQAQENPIIRLATMLRQERLPDVGEYGTSRVVRTADFDKRAMALEAQVIVGRNATRKRANDFLRERRAYAGPLPVSGDRLVCLKNNRDSCMLNGSMWTVEACCPPDDGVMSLVLASRDEEGLSVACEAHEAPFLGEDPPHWLEKEVNLFDYGYALTAHKAQGSEFEETVVVDESAAFRADRWKWAYTAATRASDKMTWVV